MFRIKSKHSVRSCGRGAVWPAMAVVCLVGTMLSSGCTSRASQASVTPRGHEVAAVRGAPAGRATRPAKLSEDCLRRVQERLDALCAEGGSPGATLGIALADGRTGALATGVSHKGTARPMRPTDRMFSGSIGKTYVSAVAFQLIEERRIDLNTKISQWLSDEEWFDRLPNARDITLRMLMNHTSGIRRHLMMPDMKARIKAEPQKIWRPEELVAHVLDTEPLFPAGEGWFYADTNYILVGMIIERVTGRTYYQELADRILKPLGLADTFPSDRPDLPGLVSGYTSEDNIFSVPTEVAENGRYAMNPQLEWTGGGLVSTALDLARWAGSLYGGKMLKEASFKQMLEGTPMSAGSEHKYGLGVMMRPSEHGQVLGHAGWVPGYVSMMAYYADHRLAVAVQVNTDVGVGLPVLQTLLDEMTAELLQCGQVALDK